MNLTIHRGTNQIGGCITEIESDGYKVFVDFGDQLPGAEKLELQPIEGLTYGDVSKSALFITHYHSDHIGKICDADADLPIYAGETALKIYYCLENRLSYIPDPAEAEKHIRIVERIKTINPFIALQEIKIGEITVTPLFIDHSAFDAYMFVVEADKKRVLHTGDFRGHGFRSKALIPTLEHYATDIDYIISEGSNIQRPNATIQTEQALQMDFEKKFRQNKYNFVFVSSTNIDRIFALYHASTKANRCFVCDSYQANILKIVSENHSHKTDFYKIDFDQKSNPAGRFFAMQPHGREPISFNRNLKPYLERHGFCMLIRSNGRFQPLPEDYAKSEDTKIYYSMWNGYLDSNKSAYNEALYKFFEPYEIEHMHTSGHADTETLKAVFEQVKPKYGIIPIHTDAPEKFLEVFQGQTIIHLKDSEIFDCNR